MTTTFNNCNLLPQSSHDHETHEPAIARSWRVYLKYAADRADAPPCNRVGFAEFCRNHLNNHDREQLEQAIRPQLQAALLRRDAEWHEPLTQRLADLDTCASSVGQRFTAGHVQAAKTQEEYDLERAIIDLLKPGTMHRSVLRSRFPLTHAVRFSKLIRAMRANGTIVERGSSVELARGVR